MTDHSVQQDSRLPELNGGLNAARSIPLQRWLALALITLESATVAYLSHTVVYPALVVCVATYGALSKTRFMMNRQRTYDIIALVAVVFVIKYMITPDNPRYTSLFPSQQMAFTLAQFVLAMQCVQFFLKRRDDRLPFSFPGIGVIALVCATMVSLPIGEQSTVQAFCVGFAVLAVLYCDASRRFVRIVPARRVGRPIATVLVLTAVGSLGWFTASSMYQYERHVEEFINRIFQQQYDDSRIGFSESSRLGSISLKKGSDSQRTALRVVSPVEPGYFRVRAYDVYENHKWLLNAEGRVLTSEETTPEELQAETNKGLAFRISDIGATGSQRLEVWPDANLRGTFAGPLRTSWLYADARIVTVDTHDIMRSGEAISGVPYTLIMQSGGQRTVSASISSPDEDLGTVPRSPLELSSLRTPPSWALASSQVRNLADSVFEDCETFNDRIKAVRHHFRENYSYSRKVALPDEFRQEPLEWFLLERPAGHCEYFASGTAVLLRMAGVPCRYVVGFVVSEQNRYSGEWIARNEDAHAWVEAYDEVNGWVTVDATPSSGVPDNTKYSAWSQLYEYMRGEFHRLRVNWQQQGFSSVPASIKAMLLSPIGLGIVTSVAVASLCFLVWRRWRHSSTDRPIYSEPSAALVPLQAAREKMDRVLKQVWRSRLPEETIETYAQQLAAKAHNLHDPLLDAANWYEHYAALRFAQSPDESSVSDVARRARKLIIHLRSRRKIVNNSEEASTTNSRT